MSAGDVEVNLGMSRFPCTVCHKTVRQNQCGICCDTCDKWTHTGWTRIGKEEYVRLSVDSELEWLCPLCTNDQSPASASRSPAPDSLPPSMHSPLGSASGLAVFRHINAQSLMNKRDELWSTLSAVSRLVVFGVSETWLNDSIPNAEVDIPSYVQYQRDRGSCGGGLLVYVLANLRSQRRPDLGAESVEAIWMELHVHERSILLSSIYRPPNADTEALDRIVAMLDMVEHENKEVVLMEDLNCDLLGPNHSTAAKNLLLIIEEHNLTQMITEPTRVTSHSESLIDLLLTTNPNIFSSSGTAPLLGSDHLMIFEECCRKVALESTVSYVRNYKKWKLDSLLSDLGNAPWQVMGTFDDIDNKWTYWKDLFLSVVDRHAPLMKLG